ncbi:MAG: hypothetical protein U0232_14775 [Thermomicrobiales bacterium]
MFACELSGDGEIFAGEGVAAGGPGFRAFFGDEEGVAVAGDGADEQGFGVEVFEGQVGAGESVGGGVEVCGERWSRAISPRSCGASCQARL